METFPIRTIGDPVLKAPSKEVTEIDGELARLVDVMYETMYEAAGVGLAAPQVGVRKRLFTYDVGDGPVVVVNPEIVESSGESSFDEGCLSIPGLRFEVIRPEKVTLRGLDLDGNEILIEDDDYIARVFQHEMDHLEGVLFLDRLDAESRKEAMRLLREIDLNAPETSTTPRL